MSDINIRILKDNLKFRAVAHTGLTRVVFSYMSNDLEIWAFSWFTSIKFSDCTFLDKYCQTLIRFDSEFSRI